jgi:CheY-like chemotaxis protein
MDDDLWSAEVDRTQITQVLSNLLINGRQAMPNGGVIQATAENKVVTEEDGLNVVSGKFIVLTVRDRGCGIPEANLNRIFDPFFTTKKKGSGLGLATSYSLVQKHRGTILVRSKRDVGTEFNIYLPATGRVCDLNETKLDEDLIAGVGCVLVVDDQESVRTVAAAILGKLGYEPITAVSGQEAVDIYRERMRSDEPVAAVLMDMTLPGGLSGEDTFEKLNEINPDICSVATSGYFDDDSHERFMDRGFAALLPKPYTAETLSKVLHDVMHGEKSVSPRGPKDAGSGKGEFVPAD